MERNRLVSSSKSLTLSSINFFIFFKMKYVNKVQEALKEVYLSKKYFLVTFSVALVIFLFNTLVNNYRILFSDFSFLLLFSLLIGTLASMTAFSVVLLFVMSILAGIVTAMTICLVKRQVKGNLGASSAGILMSFIAPACPSCAIGLLSVLGFSGFLAVLPFKGLELSFLGTGLLGISVVYLSNKITTKTCSIAVPGGSTMERNYVSIKKSTLWKGVVVMLIAVLGFFVFQRNFGNGVTGNVVAAGDSGMMEIATVLKDFEYQPDTITVKKGSTVRLTIDNKDNVNHGLHLMQFGVMRGLEPKSKTTVEFVAKETPTNGQVVPTCAQEHGETLTINVV